MGLMETDAACYHSMELQSIVIRGDLTSHFFSPAVSTITTETFCGGQADFSNYDSFNCFPHPSCDISLLFKLLHSLISCDILHTGKCCA